MSIVFADLDRFKQVNDTHGHPTGDSVLIETARLSATGRNLISWFPYTGLDPEVSVFGNQNITTAQDVFEYPPSRSFFFSLDLGL